MGLEGSLLVTRLYYVLAMIADKLEGYLLTDRFASLFDEEQILRERRLALSLGLKDGQSILIVERYAFRRYQLEITQYNYALLASDGTPSFSCDNAPHHPEVRTFPHHKHRYPKERFPPADFSGDLGAFLDDVRWELSR
jgi:hypothetical protein